MKTLIKIALIVMFFAISYELSATNCYADIPHLINYQGKLTDTAGKPVLDGSYSVTFRIYDVESGGSSLWEETQSISVSKGIFSIMLGGVTALNLAFDKPYWLEIKVKDEVMSPRQRMTSVGYAIRAQDANQAQNADKVDDFHANPTPTANNILVADANAKLPASALKVYDSGWFAVTAGTTYSKTHNLGTTKFVAFNYFSTSANGDNAETMIFDGVGDASYGYGIQLKSITTTTLTAQFGAAGHRRMDASGYLSTAESGYARIILLALE